jgi:hypothetical protein
MFRFHMGSCYKRRWRGTDTRHERAALEFSKDAENALPGRMPVERAKIFLFKIQVETLYSRRPLRARRKASRVCRLSFHPVDPPLEPQDGRLHSLRPNPQDEPENAKKTVAVYYPPKCFVSCRRMSGLRTTEPIYS